MATPTSRPFLAIALVLLSITGFDLMAVIVKVLTSRGYSPVELSTYRNIFGMLPPIALMLFLGELKLERRFLILKKWRMALFRGLMVALAQLAFYTSLSLMELATIATLAQSSALFVVIMSVLFFRERVGLWRSGAVILGFIGVVLVLRPGSDTFTVLALLPIVAAACYGFSMVSVRFFTDGESNGLLLLYSSVASILASVVMVLASTGFSPVASAQDAGLVLLMSMVGGVSVLTLMVAYRMAEGSTLAPFVFVSILTSLFFGWLFFGELPVTTLFPGVILIVGAGGLILWRERVKARGS